MTSSANSPEYENSRLKAHAIREALQQTILRLEPENMAFVLFLHDGTANCATLHSNLVEIDALGLVVSALEELDRRVKDE